MERQKIQKKGQSMLSNVERFSVDEIIYKMNQMKKKLPYLA